ncbi:MAG: AEC family transporter [Pseudomonadota bacterium]
MNNLILLIVCFSAGILLRRSGRMPENAPATINVFIIYISVPALTLLYLHDFKFGADILLISIMPWLMFAFSAGFFWLVGRWLGLPRSTTGALMLTGGMSNTAFFGLPMVEAYYGHSAIPIAIVIDQLGSFMVVSTLGITVAGIYSSGRPTLAEIVKRIALFPPIIALIATLVLIPVEYADWFTALLKRLGDTLAPLALLSVGLQLQLGHVAEHRRDLAIGLLFKLLVAPLLILLLYVPLYGAHGQAIQVTIFEAAMPPMITAAIVATEHDLNPPLANLMVAVGLIISFVTLSMWWFMLRWV